MSIHTQTRRKRVLHCKIRSVRLAHFELLSGQGNPLHRPRQGDNYRQQ